MNDQRLPRECRLRRQLDFQRVYSRRRSVSDGMLIVYGCENDLSYTRFGLSVSRKVGGAVVRNRWKRLLREAFRLNRSKLPSGLDVIFRPRENAEPDFHTLIDTLPRMIERLQRRLAKNNP